MAFDVNITYSDMSAPVEKTSAAGTTAAPKGKGTKAPKVAGKATHEDIEMTDAGTSVQVEGPRASAPEEDEEDLEVITHKKTGNTSMDVSSKVTSKRGKGLFDLPPVLTTGLRSGRVAKAQRHEVLLDTTKRRATELHAGDFRGTKHTDSTLERSSRDITVGSKHVQGVGSRSGQRSPILRDNPLHKNLQTKGIFQSKEHTSPSSGGGGQKEKADPVGHKSPIPHAQKQCGIRGGEPLNPRRDGTCEETNVTDLCVLQNVPSSSTSRSVVPASVVSQPISPLKGNVGSRVRSNSATPVAERPREKNTPSVVVIESGLSNKIDEVCKQMLHITNEIKQSNNTLLYNIDECN